MSVSLQAETKLKTHIYFTWAERLWYVADLTSQPELGDENEQEALLEDCYTEEVKWVKVRFFQNSMKEVTPTIC